MIKKIGLAIVYLFFAIIIYQYGETILSWIQNRGYEFVIFAAIIAALLAMFPIIPYPIVGGVIGAAYGTIIGGVVTWFGSIFAAVFMFFILRYGYQDWGQKVLYRYKMINKMTTTFENHAFLTIFITRMFPIIPSIAINSYSALSKVSFTHYSIASALGKMPSMILYVVIGDSLINNPETILATVTLYIVFLASIMTLYKWWTKRTAAGSEPKLY